MMPHTCHDKPLGILCGSLINSQENLYCLPGTQILMPHHILHQWCWSKPIVLLMGGKPSYVRFLYFQQNDILRWWLPSASEHVFEHLRSRALTEALINFLTISTVKYRMCLLGFWLNKNLNYATVSMNLLTVVRQCHWWGTCRVASELWQLSHTAGIHTCTGQDIRMKGGSTSCTSTRSQWDQLQATDFRGWP
jgi:hypothetical protein